MGQDYEQWKKRRETERARREREAAEEARRREGAPPPSPGYRIVEPPREPKRGYQGRIPIAPEPAPRGRRTSEGGTVRGCLGCLGLLVGGLILLAIALGIFGSLYWRQIEQRGKVNVLILGIDERPTEEPPFRSDTMILSAFNPRRREVALMSIPRDLWMAIPGQGNNRINTAYFYGGPTLAKQAVAVNFGVPLHYYVKVNFDGFTQIVDAMGGISLNVPEALHDENYPTLDYGVMTIDIPAGEQQMDGATALIYARSRYSTNDFDRGRRQQEIINAIRNKLATPTTWPKAPAIFAAARAAVTTDIPAGEWPALTFILVRSTVVRAAIGADDTQDFVTDGGAQVLSPIWERINPTLSRYFE